MTTVHFGRRKELTHPLNKVLPNTGVVMMVVEVVNCHEGKERVESMKIIFPSARHRPNDVQVHKFIRNFMHDLPHH